MQGLHELGKKYTYIALNSYINSEFTTMLLVALETQANNEILKIANIYWISTLSCNETPF